MKHLGYFLLILSILVWALIFMLPFAGLSGNEMAGYGAALYVVSYALFFAGGVLVGKDALDGLKRSLRLSMRPSVEPESSTDEASPEP